MGSERTSEPSLVADWLCIILSGTLRLGELVCKIPEMTARCSVLVIGGAVSGSNFSLAIAVWATIGEAGPGLFL